MGQDNETYLYRHSGQIAKSQQQLVTVEPNLTFWDQFSAGSRAKKIVEASVSRWQKALETLETDLAEKGLLGKHELLATPHIGRGTDGYIKGDAKVDGSFFLFFGGLHAEAKIRGESRTAYTVTFAWNPNNQDTLVTEIPAYKLIFKQDAGISVPSVEFTFDPKEFIRPSAFPGTLEVDSFLNPNDYLKHNLIAQATMFIHPQDLKSLPISDGVSSA